MQTENFEIINLNPNINYEDSSEDESEGEDTVMESMQVCDETMHSNSNDSFGIPEVKTRKKLNLAEYKVKRANQPAPTINTIGTTLELCEIIPDSLPPIDLPSDPRAYAKFLSQINNEPQKQHEVKTVKEESSLPPAIHPDYEEIILVSTCCNTDITIPPNDEQSQTSMNFLTNIVNSFPNDKLVSSSTNSLFSSINEMLQKKCEKISSDQVVSDKKEEYHGEDKVIMHLRKDRIRPQRSSQSIQTEATPLFPSLVLSPALTFNRIRQGRSYRRSSRSRSRSRSRSFSPESEYYNSGNGTYYHHFDSNPFVRSSHHNSAYSSSMNSSEMDTNTSDSDSSAYSSARSSGQGSIKRFTSTYRDYRQQRDGGKKIQDERKIIYVGEILKETTKEELRRKFITYGSIRKISLHAREDGSLRYGFVTFVDSSAAYEVLDKFVTDPAICNYDIRFGGRRKFCKQTYADLDNEIDAEGKICSNSSSSIGTNNISVKSNVKSKELSFEDLLQAALLAKQKLQAANK